MNPILQEHLMALGFSELGGRTPSPNVLVIIPDYRPSRDRRVTHTPLSLPFLHLPRGLLVS